jgi:hypothetical protein
MTRTSILAWPASASRNGDRCPCNHALDKVRSRRLTRIVSWPKLRCKNQPRFARNAGLSRHVRPVSGAVPEKSKDLSVFRLVPRAEQQVGCQAILELGGTGYHPRGFPVDVHFSWLQGAAIRVDGLSR